MILFLGVYLALYGGMNLYLALRVRQGLRAGVPGTVALGLVVALLVLGPILARLLDRSGHALAHPVGVVSYLWMAVSFWGAILWLVRDAWNGAARLASVASPDAGRLALGSRPALLVVAVAVVAATAWGWREARDIRLERLTVTTDRLPAGAPPLTIAQISDLHVGLLTTEGEILRVAGLVREARPDLLVSTGDLVDGAGAHFNHVADVFNSLDPPLGKYAITGNHEVYAGLESSLAFTRSCGFRLVRGESVEVAPGLRLIGVDDPAAIGPEGSARQEEAVLSAGGDEGFRLLLKHRPQPGRGSPGRFDLQLSGHTHKGQIFPFGCLVRLTNRFLAGWFDLGSGSALYVSRGTGTWGPPLRLFAPPQITLVTLAPR